MTRRRDLERCYCPQCGAAHNHVVRTYSLNDLSQVRRRHCLDCDHRWYTHQHPEEPLPAGAVQWGRNEDGVADRIVALRGA